jgi:hypothetical protein
MSKTTTIYKNRFNRKKVFEADDLRLWMNIRPGRERGNPVAALEVMRRKPGTRSKWDTCWSGIVKIEEWGATVETTSK